MCTTQFKVNGFMPYNPLFVSALPNTAHEKAEHNAADPILIINLASLAQLTIPCVQCFRPAVAARPLRE